MRPRMIFFDYGNTLVYEEVKQNIESLRGVYNSIVDKEKINFQEFYDQFLAKKEIYRNNHHPFDKEFKYTDLFEKLFQKFQATSELSFEEVSEIYFDDYAPGYPMEGAWELLDYLEEEDIKFGVISNLSWSSNILRKRLEKIFERHMGPVLTTGDYIFRKPDKKIFEIAADISGYNPLEIWYVGDNPLCDIYGSNLAGMTPVYFRAKTENVFMKDAEMINLDFEHIDVDHLLEIKEILEKRQRW